MDEKTIIMKAFLKQVRVNKFHTLLTIGMGVGLYFMYRKVTDIEGKLERLMTEERD